MHSSGLYSSHRKRHKRALPWRYPVSKWGVHCVFEDRFDSAWAVVAAVEGCFQELLPNSSRATIYGPPPWNPTRIRAPPSIDAILGAIFVYHIGAGHCMAPPQILVCHTLWLYATCRMNTSVFDCKRIADNF